MSDEIKVGATVTIRGKVRMLSKAVPGDIFVDFLDGNPAWISAMNIISVENPPEELKVGDPVRHLETGTRAEVRGIDKDVVWVIYGDGFYTTWDRSEVEKVSS